MQGFIDWADGFAAQNPIGGRGVNAFTLVFNGGRWWIATIAWDEEDGAGPVPERFMP